MMTVRRATLEDSADVLQWRNDPVAIEMSLERTEVLAEDHQKWFPGTLDTDECVHVIGEVTKPDQTVLKTGVCRFDRTHLGRWLVSINLNPTMRGRGLASDFLERAIEYLTTCLPSPETALEAKVRKQNVQSIKVFERNGFQTTSKLANVVCMERKLG